MYMQETSVHVHVYIFFLSTQFVEFVVRQSTCTVYACTSFCKSCLIKLHKTIYYHLLLKCWLFSKVTMQLQLPMLHSREGTYPHSATAKLRIKSAFIGWFIIVLLNLVLVGVLHTFTGDPLFPYCRYLPGVAMCSSSIWFPFMSLLCYAWEGFQTGTRVCTCTCINNRK